MALTKLRGRRVTPYPSSKMLSFIVILQLTTSSIYGFQSPVVSSRHATSTSTSTSSSTATRTVLAYKDRFVIRAGPDNENDNRANKSNPFSQLFDNPSQKSSEGGTDFFGFLHPKDGTSHGPEKKRQNKPAKPPNATTPPNKKRQRLKRSPLNTEPEPSADDANQISSLESDLQKYQNRSAILQDTLMKSRTERDTMTRRAEILQDVVMELKRSQAEEIRLLRAGHVTAERSAEVRFERETNLVRTELLGRLRVLEEERREDTESRAVEVDRFEALFDERTSKMRALENKNKKAARRYEERQNEMKVTVRSLEAQLTKSQEEATLLQQQYRLLIQQNNTALDDATPTLTQKSPPSQETAESMNIAMASVQAHEEQEKELLLKIKSLQDNLLNLKQCHDQDIQDHVDKLHLRTKELEDLANQLELSQEKLLKEKFATSQAKQRDIQRLEEMVLEEKSINEGRLDFFRERLKEKNEIIRDFIQMRDENEKSVGTLREVVNGKKDTRVRRIRWRFWRRSEQIHETKNDHNDDDDDVIQIVNESL